MMSSRMSSNVIISTSPELTLLHLVRFHYIKQTVSLEEH